MAELQMCAIHGDVTNEARTLIACPLCRTAELTRLRQENERLRSRVSAFERYNRECELGDCHTRPEGDETTFVCNACRVAQLERKHSQEFNALNAELGLQHVDVQPEHATLRVTRLRTLRANLDEAVGLVRKGPLSGHDESNKLTDDHFWDMDGACDCDLAGIEGKKCWYCRRRAFLRRMEQK